MVTWLQPMITALSEIARSRSDMLPGRCTAVLIAALLTSACGTKAPQSSSAPAESRQIAEAEAAATIISPVTTPAQDKLPPKLPTQQRQPAKRFVSASHVSAKSLSYDPAGPGFNLLQAPREALQAFPADANGDIDWVKVLASRLISPRADLHGREQIRILDLDIIMKRTKDMPWVLFPHRQHSEWLACSNCHPRPFTERAGANDMDMDSIMRGEHCGLCHDRVSFSIYRCERCHSLPHRDSPPPWW